MDMVCKSNIWVSEISCCFVIAAKPLLIDDASTDSQVTRLLGDFVSMKTLEVLFTKTTSNGVYETHITTLSSISGVLQSTRQNKHHCLATQDGPLVLELASDAHSTSRSQAILCPSEKDQITSVRVSFDAAEALAVSSYSEPGQPGTPMIQDIGLGHQGICVAKFDSGHATVLRVGKDGTLQSVWKFTDGVGDWRLHNPHISQSPHFWCKAFRCVEPRRGFCRIYRSWRLAIHFARFVCPHPWSRSTSHVCDTRTSGPFVDSSCLLIDQLGSLEILSLTPTEFTPEGMVTGLTFKHDQAENGNIIHVPQSFVFVLAFFLADWRFERRLRPKYSRSTTMCPIRGRWLSLSQVPFSCGKQPSYSGSATRISQKWQRPSPTTLTKRLVRFWVWCPQTSLSTCLEPHG